VQCYVRGPVRVYLVDRFTFGWELRYVGRTCQELFVPNGPSSKRILTGGPPSTYGQWRGAIYLEAGLAVTYSTVGPHVEQRGLVFWSVRPDDAGEERRL